MTAPPLARIDITKIQKAIYESDVNRSRFDLMERAGMNVAELRARNEAQIGSLKALLDVYGPQRG